jgi:hypothetical protein
MSPSATSYGNLQLKVAIRDDVRKPQQSGHNCGRIADCVSCRSIFEDGRLSSRFNVDWLLSVHSHQLLPTASTLKLLTFGYHQSYQSY